MCTLDDCSDVVEWLNTVQRYTTLHTYTLYATIRNTLYYLRRPDADTVNNMGCSAVDDDFVFNRRRRCV